MMVMMLLKWFPNIQTLRNSGNFNDYKNNPLHYLKLKINNIFNTFACLYWNTLNIETLSPSEIKTPVLSLLHNAMETAGIKTKPQVTLLIVVVGMVRGNRAVTGVYFVDIQTLNTSAAAE